MFFLFIWTGTGLLVVVPISGIEPINVFSRTSPTPKPGAGIRVVRVVGLRDCFQNPQAPAEHETHGSSEGREEVLV